MVSTHRGVVVNAYPSGHKSADKGADGPTHKGPSGSLCTLAAVYSDSEALLQIFVCVFSSYVLPAVYSDSEALLYHPCAFWAHSSRGFGFE